MQLCSAQLKEMLRGAVGAERECRALHSFVRGLSERSEGAAVDMVSVAPSWGHGWLYRGGSVQRAAQPHRLFTNLLPLLKPLMRTGQC